MNSKHIVYVLAALFSGTAFATGNYDGMGSSPSTSSEFQRLDANQDGALSKSELGTEPALLEDWSRIDNNGDGYLDQSEFSMFETMEKSKDSNNGTSTGTP